jgi:hypothetical protein
MSKTPYVIVTAADRKGPLINRTMGPDRYVADDASSLQPLPITQAELDAMTALGLIKP